jgi:hypothetical protein
VPHDYWLSGKDNFTADRVAGDETIAAFPGIRLSAQANRAFLRRTVRYLAESAGIRQFLDIGTGLPAADNTHEVSQAIAPESKVVYVDNDPLVLAHARALLTSRPEGATAYLDAELRDTGTILGQAAGTLDFSRPVAVMLLAILHYIPDLAEARRIVAQLTAAVPAGSFLVISHAGSDLLPDDVAAFEKSLNSHLPPSITTSPGRVTWCPACSTGCSWWNRALSGSATGGRIHPRRRLRTILWGGVAGKP